jgi:hypothetical protein
VTVGEVDGLFLDLFGTSVLRVSSVDSSEDVRLADYDDGKETPSSNAPSKHSALQAILKSFDCKCCGTA